jgi:hypothetical protein
MSEMVRVEEILAAGGEERSRRQALRSIAVAALLGPLAGEAAAQVHQHVAEEKKRAAGAAYKPKHLSAAEFEMMGVLSDIIIPGARKAGAAEFIDLLCHGNEEFAASYTGGLAWMNHWMRTKHGVEFVAAGEAQRKDLLDRIAYRKNMTPELAPGIEFFDLARRMCSDAYFTSREGVKEIGFLGNGSAAKFEVPQEVVDYVLRRSPV